MSEYFDKVRAIVFDRGTKTGKIEKLQSELGCTAYEANTYYRQLQPLIEVSSRPVGLLRFTIGVEIECYNIDKNMIIAALDRRGIKAIATGYNHTDSKEHYKLGNDGSIDGNNTCEVVSPILRSLSSLKEVCEVINEAGAKVNKSCGLHVHFGASKFTLEQWQRICLNYAAIEPVIDSFMAPSRREGNNTYCGSTIRSANTLRGEIAGGYIHSIHDIQQCYGTRYKKLNVIAYNTHKTVEFRQHQGTTDFVKISNWVDFLTRFLDWSLKHDELISASTIDELPFLTEKLRRFYNGRKAEFNANNNA